MIRVTLFRGVLFSLILLFTAAGQEKTDPAALLNSMKERAAGLLRRELPRPPAVVRIRDFLDRGIAEAKAHPQMLRVRGVVTCVASDERWFFVQDDSAGTMVMMGSAGPKPEPGQQVTVEAGSAPCGWLNKLSR